MGQDQETHIPIPALPPKSYMTLGKSFTFLASHPSSDMLIIKAQQEADDSLIVLNGVIGPMTHGPSISCNKRYSDESGNCYGLK